MEQYLKPYNVSPNLCDYCKYQLKLFRFHYLVDQYYLNYYHIVIFVKILKKYNNYNFYLIIYYNLYYEIIINYVNYIKL